jgi:hypothetical protein
MKKAILLIVIIFSSSEILAKNKDDFSPFMKGLAGFPVVALPGILISAIAPIKDIRLARVGIGVSPILFLASWQMFLLDEDPITIPAMATYLTMGSYSAVGGLTRLLKKDVTEEGCQNKPSVKKLSPSELKRLARGFKPRPPRL